VGQRDPRPLRRGDRAEVPDLREPAKEIRVIGTRDGAAERDGLLNREERARTLPPAGTVSPEFVRCEWSDDRMIPVPPKEIGAVRPSSPRTELRREDVGMIVMVEKEPEETKDSSGRPIRALIAQCIEGIEGEEKKQIRPGEPVLHPP
jgi:hypothetical protein